MLNPQDCMCEDIRRTARALTSAYEAALKPVGLTVGQFTLLSLLKGMGPMPLSALAEHADLDRTTLSRNLTPLTRRGLVEAQATEDRRVKSMTLTASGRDLHSEALPLWREAQSRYLARLGEPVARNFQTLTAQLRD